MTTTIQPGALPFLTPDQLARSSEVDIKNYGAGSGLVALEKNAPPPPSEENIGKLAASLSSFMSKGAGGADVDVLLVQIAVSMRDTEATSQKDKIKTDQEAKKAQLQEKEKKLEEAQKKLDEAKERQRNGNLIDKIKLAFEWIGMVLAFVVAAVAIATGAGAVVGTLLMAAAVTALVMAIDSTVTAATGHGIAGNIAKAMGKSKEEIAQADMGFKIAMAVTGIVLSLAAGGAGMAGAVKSAATAGKTAAEMGMSLKEVAMTAKSAFVAGLKDGTATMTQAGKLATVATSVSDGVVQGGTAAMEGARAGIKYEETKLRSEGKELEAKAKVDQAMMQILDDMIDQALTRLMAVSDRFNNILDDIMSAVDDRGSTLSKARFAG